jgi:hypothetical protein
MPSLGLRAALAAAATSAALALALAPPATAQRAEYAQVSSYIPARIDSSIGFIPSHGMNPADRPPSPTTVRLGGRTYRFVYQNSAVVWPGTGLILRTLARSSGYAAASSGAFVDRRLTVRNRRRLVVRADLGREADVVVVARGHPACATGLTRAQARGIARGTIQRWSEVVGLPPGQPDAIAVRVKTDGYGDMEPRWGVRDARRFAPGARGATDGGLGQAASGDPAVAGLTSWSRARGYASSVCALPINGVAPTDATVYELRYAAAYPITYVVARALERAPRKSRAMMKGFIDWLRGPQAAEQFRARGMMLTADGPPAP